MKIRGIFKKLTLFKTLERQIKTRFMSRWLVWEQPGRPSYSELSHSFLGPGFSKKACFEYLFFFSWSKLYPFLNLLLKVNEFGSDNTFNQNLPICKKQRVSNNVLPHKFNFFNVMYPCVWIILTCLYNCNKSYLINATTLCHC